MTRSLKRRTLELLTASPMTNTEVAAAIGVTAGWVGLFRSERINDPSVNRIQRLYEYLAGEPLFRDHEDDARG